MTKAQIREAMVYAVAKLDDGGCMVTVFEKKKAATMVLSKEMRAQLIRVLSDD